MKIHDIPRPKGANRAHRRVGRGSGSGHGKTSGRGAKGQKSRKGSSLRLGFEGGQMSLVRRLPKRGFTRVIKKVYQVVNVEKLNHFRKDSPVDKVAMKKAGIIKNSSCPVKILGDGKLTKSLAVSADAFSKEAKKKILDAGGKIETANK
ncbi:MAG: 50S ribosomal protein L15 [Candidatus Omnitrophota bacterium]|nr:MAG: 50S ribosomal protein L15 [Candidatus Omnitrophota bacterium]